MHATAVTILMFLSWTLTPLARAETVCQKVYYATNDCCAGKCPMYPEVQQAADRLNAGVAQASLAANLAPNSMNGNAANFSTALSLKADYFRTVMIACQAAVQTCSETCEGEVNLCKGVGKRYLPGLAAQAGMAQQNAASAQYSSDCASGDSACANRAFPQPTTVGGKLIKYGTDVLRDVPAARRPAERPPTASNGGRG